jgi:hypothetical protein
MRINFEFTEEQVKALKTLQIKTGSSSMKEMFNSAMSLLEWAVNETAKGNEIAAISADRAEYRVLVMPILSKVLGGQGALQADSELVLT